MAQGTGRRTLAAKVVDNCIGRSKEKNTPSVRILVRTEYDIARPDVPEILNLTGDLWLTFACVERTFRTLEEAFGWTGVNGSLNIEELNEPTLVGKRCCVVVEPDDRDPDRLKIVFFNRPSSLRRVDTEELGSISHEVKDFLDRLRPAGVDLHPAAAQFPASQQSAAAFEAGIAGQDDGVHF